MRRRADGASDLPITQVGREVRYIEYCRIADAAIAMKLCRLPPPDAELLRSRQLKFRAAADKLEGKPAR